VENLYCGGHENFSKSKDLKIVVMKMFGIECETLEEMVGYKSWRSGNMMR
jgi:hypothetical protein